MLNRPLIIALVAGEISGDILGAGLITEFKTRYPNTRFVGVAGPLMQDVGCEVWYRTEDLAVMGIIEVVGSILRLLKIRSELTRRFIKLKPDVFIGIDAPDFNITLEGNIKRAGIRTIHYVSPSIWAWRQQRIFQLKKNTNLILVFLPFEKLLYDKFNVPCRFIGHTIADSMPLYPDKLGIRYQLGISEKSICLSLLPGSRISEVEMLSADFLNAAQLLYQRYPELKIFVPLANTKCRSIFEHIKGIVAPNLEMQLLDGKSREVMIASDIVILASGTAALECMLAKCPMVVGYRLKPISFWIIKYLIKTPYISLPNLLAGQEIVKELIQDKCNPVSLAKAIDYFLNNDSKRALLINIFNELHQRIRCNADRKAVDAVLEIIDEKKI